MITEIIVMNQLEAERYRARPGDAVISITDPGAPLAKLQSGWTEILRIEFADIQYDRETIEYWGRAWQDVKGVFRAEHARQIQSFTDALENNPAIARLIVHCHAGKSRSAAVATWVAQRNLLVINSKWSGRNTTVLDMLATPDLYEWAWQQERLSGWGRARALFSQMLG